MKKIRLSSSGGHINILDMGDAAIPGEINFAKKEWEHCLRIGKDPTDPVKEKEFFREVFNKKAANADYSFFSDFPDTEHREISLAEKYATEIKQMIMHGKKDETPKA